ncbi:MAG: 2-C-methyl-D-erythritol 2,4-cyclodiphosphate synthase [bacterium]|nr:2-C-methyl-D-erythritol 2,4-cyclodiphosphate synthase [bacterium]
MTWRSGIGFDAHRCVAGRPLVLGGVMIPSEFGLDAHSDGDVLAHAILDALLGAAALGDKGLLFPPSDPQYKNIRSMILLERAAALLTKNRFRIANVDATVICERPQLLDYIPSMRQEIAAALRAQKSRVSVKATTAEGMGFTGRCEGIAALATVMLSCGANDDAA